MAKGGVVVRVTAAGAPSAEGLVAIAERLAPARALLLPRAARIVDRDLKPQNLLLEDGRGAGDQRIGPPVLEVIVVRVGSIRRVLVCGPLRQWPITPSSVNPGRHDDTRPPARPRPLGGCALSYGDDGVGIKAGYNEDGRRVGISAENIVVTGCEMSHGHSGVAIGSETAGDIRNVLVSDCVIHDAINGVYIRAPRGRGGTVEQIRVSNLVLDRIEEVAIKVSQFFDSIRMDILEGGSARGDMEIARSRRAPVDVGTPTFRSFAFSGMTMGTVGRLALIEGLPERLIRVLIEGLTARQASGGLYCTLAADVSISGVGVDTLESAVVDAREVEGLEVNRVRCAQPCPEAPAVWLESVTGAFVHGYKFGSPGPGYQWFREEQCRGATLAANDAGATAPARGKRG
jgi:hypothetical protein